MFNLIDLRRVDLNLLVVFETVFRERSVKRAAARLFVGQSAVSMALSRLRELFEDELFVKVATGVEPTTKAVALEPRVRQVLELAHRTVFETNEFDPSTASRVIRVAMAEQIEMWLLPRLLDELQVAAPGLTIVVRPATWQGGLGFVERGDVDLAIGPFPKAGAAFESETITQAVFLSIFDPEHVPAPLSMKRFIATPHVMMSTTGDLVGLVDEALRARGKERRLVATVPGFATLGTLLKGRALIATIPDFAAETLARVHGLATATPPVAMPTYSVSMVWHAAGDRDPALRWFRERVRTIVQRDRDV